MSIKKGYILRITIVTTLVLSMLSSMGGAQCEHPDVISQWAYYRPIYFETGAYFDPGAPVLLTLEGDDFPIEAQNDGDDIRFVMDSEFGCHYIINYWIEMWNSTGRKAKIWVNVTHINGEPLTHINDELVSVNMYWGNPLASSLSNGKRTFDFFDDFSGIHSLSDYKIVDNGTGGQTPSNWTMDYGNKLIKQTRKIYFGRFGTALLTNVNLSNFEVLVKTKEGEGVYKSIIGLLFSYKNSSQFYHYSYSHDYLGKYLNNYSECPRGSGNPGGGSNRWIGKGTTGICSSKLANDSQAPLNNYTVEIKIRRFNNTITVFQNNTEILSTVAIDDGWGDIGLMTEANEKGKFYPPFIIRKYIGNQSVVLGNVSCNINCW